MAEDIVEQRGPFDVLGREIRHDQFGMRLVADTTLERSERKLGNFFWVEFTRPAVLVFALDKERNIYLSKKFTYATNDYPTEVPGGPINDGEDPEQAARREVRDELGLEIDDLRYLCTHYAITSRVYNRTHLFLARVTSVGEAKPSPGEDIHLRRVPFDEAVQMVRDKQISTPSVEAGIWRIKDLLEVEG